MGLDMYALCESKDGVREDFWRWRKHHNLHGWMERLYYGRGGTEEFNCVDLELSDVDLNALEEAVTTNKLPHTEGFFFGNNPPDEETKKDDLEFIASARDLLRDGYKVFYTSWW